MQETDDDLKQLQTLVAESIEKAGTYLRRCFEMPEHCLSAAQLVRHLEGLKTLVIATVTAKGEPRTAPVASIFYRGQFHIPTLADSARARQIAARPAVSLSYFDENDLAIVVHGQGVLLTRDHADFEPLDTILKQINGRGVLDWGEGIYIRVVADRLFTFARYIDRFPGDRFSTEQLPG